MLAASGLALALRPTQKIAEQGPPLNLEVMIPHTFGGWREEEQNRLQIVDPQQQQTIDRIYTQILNRTYVNAAGYRIMLAIAYGDDQRDAMQAHYPEICYPAQGFEVLSRKSGNIESPEGNIPVMRLATSLQNRRLEPVTYWVMIGDVAITGGWYKKLAEMRYGLKGFIPDGLLFRVSSIDDNNEHAFQMHQLFITDILSSVSPQERKRISGT
jgi:EpsI family protein